MIKIGNCPDSWGVWFDKNDKQMDWRRYLDEVAEAGYRYTEIGPYGYMSTDARELAAELEKRNLTPVAGTVMFDIEDDGQLAGAIETARSACGLLRDIGAEYYIIMDGMYTDLITDEQLLPATLTDEGFDRLCANYRELAGVVRGCGVKPVFHPHGGTHVETEEQIDKMLAKIPADELRICFDTGHHIYVQGNDVYAYTKKIADRIDFLHLKDLNEEIKEQMWRQKVPYATATKKNVFAEIGNGGQIDWERYAQVLREVGFEGYAVIEHDCYPADFDVPKGIQSRTGAFLERIGLGVLR